VDALYWDTIGATKTFTHPVDFGWLSALPRTARILDYGCGYGRVTALARSHGFTTVQGVDPSPSLVARARREHPDLRFALLPSPPSLPYADASFDAVLLIAVLTCIPADDDQSRLIAELARVLRPGGLLYVSDLLLGTDLSRYDPAGVFTTGDGAVLRHHSAERLEGLLRSRFAVGATRELTVRTMNGNAAQALQILGAKRPLP
jgi:SAM-dependent methyltransferase